MRGLEWYTFRLSPVTAELFVACSLMPTNKTMDSSSHATSAYNVYLLSTPND